MLSLAKVTREMGEHYFSNDEYYSRESGPAKPEFYGRGADILGIKNDFNSITFQKLLLLFSNLVYLFAHTLLSKKLLC